MISAEIINTQEIFHPPFNGTLSAMMQYTKRNPDDIDTIKKMVALSSKTCYNIYDSEQLVMALPLRDKKRVLLLELKYPKDDAEKLMIVDINQELVLLRIIGE